MATPDDGAERLIDLRLKEPPGLRAQVLQRRIGGQWVAVRALGRQGIERVGGSPTREGPTVFLVYDLSRLTD